MSEYIYYFYVNERKQSAGMAGDVIAQYRNIILKNYKSNIKVLKCPCRVTGKNLRGLTESHFGPGPLLPGPPFGPDPPARMSCHIFTRGSLLLQIRLCP